MSQGKQNKIVVVLGMHRSGTSAITRSLELLGVGLGDNLHSAGFDNPTGFWEDRECLEINDDLLRVSHSAYDRLGLAQQFIQDDSSIGHLKQKAKQLIVRKLQENDGIWGFKDPRTCRLLPFWRDVFDSVGCEANYIIAIRNPASVASSLLSRNNLPFEKSYLLWQQHIVPAVLDSAGFSRVVVDYDMLLEAPLEQITRISAALSLPMADASGPIFRAFVNDFLNKDLRHKKHTLSDLEMDDRVPVDVISAYEILLSAASHETLLDDPDFDIRFKELNERLEAYAPAFSYANALEAERTSLYLAIADRERELDAYRVQAVEFARQVNALQGAAEAAQSHVAHQASELDAYRVQAAEFGRQISALQAELEAAQSHIADQAGALDEFARQVNALQAELEGAHAKHADESASCVFSSRRLMSLVQRMARAFTKK